MANSINELHWGYQLTKKSNKREKQQHPNSIWMICSKFKSFLRKVLEYPKWNAFVSKKWEFWDESYTSSPKDFKHETSFHPCFYIKHKWPNQYMVVGRTPYKQVKRLKKWQPRGRRVSHQLEVEWEKQEAPHLTRGDLDYWTETELHRKGKPSNPNAQTTSNYHRRGKVYAILLWAWSSDPSSG